MRQALIRIPHNQLIFLDYRNPRIDLFDGFDIDLKYDLAIELIKICSAQENTYAPDNSGHLMRSYKSHLI